MQKDSPVLNMDSIASANISKLNVGCGNAKIPGYWNIDSNPDNKPDQVVDIINEWPFAAESISTILFFHTIEHIEEKYHNLILARFHSALVPDGELYISYPEFTIVANNYITNYRGMREFWKNTIYGLQRAPGDYHVALMDTDYFMIRLLELGFKDIEYREESPEEPFNSLIRCRKGELPLQYEDIINREIFNT